MGNFLRDMYKRLRGDGASFREARQAVREERASQEAEDAFAKAFGAPFDELARRAMQRHLAELLPNALPDPLFALAQDGIALGSPSSDDPGTLVASLSRATGAYWGPAPESVPASTAAFHATATWDGEKYSVSMLEGSAQVVRHTTRFVSGGPWEVTTGSIWVWLKWTRGDGSNTTGNNQWEVKKNDSEPAMDGDLNVPLFKFTFGANGNGTLVQYIEGSVYLAWTVNALDVDA